MNIILSNYVKNKTKGYPIKRVAEKLHQYEAVIVDGNNKLVYLKSIVPGQRYFFYKKDDVILKSHLPIEQFYKLRCGHLDT